MVDISSTRQSIPRKAPSQLNFNKTGDSILKESHLSVQKDSNSEYSIYRNLYFAYFCTNKEFKVIEKWINTHFTAI